MASEQNFAFSSTTPAAAPGYCNTVPQLGGTDPALISLYVRNTGGVDARTTTTETIGIASLGKGVTLNNAGAIAVTLDSTAPNYFWCVVGAIGAGAATLTPSSGTINGAASLALSSPAILFFDGTNWRAFLSGGAGSGTTWYSGGGVPSSGTGANGDYYLRTTTGDVYTKVAGSWGSPIENLTGPAGATGATGATGPAGPAPGGTGFVRVTSGTLENPATITGPDTDGTLSANSDTALASQKATKTYVDKRSVRRVSFSAFNTGGLSSGAIALAIQADFAGTIIGWSLFVDAGTISIDVCKHASSAPPSAPAVPNTTTDKISASAPLQVSSGTSASATSSGVSTWTTAVAQWDSILLNISAVSGASKVQGEILIQM